MCGSCTVVHVQSGSVEESGFGDEGPCLPVELVDGGVAVSKEEHFRWVTGLRDVAAPVLNGSMDGVVGGGCGIDPVAPFVHRYGTVHRPVTKLSQDGPFPMMFLPDVLGQRDSGKSGNEGDEEPSGVDLSELMVVTDQDELP